MNKRNERFWTVAGILFLCLLLISIAFHVGKTVGSRPDEYTQRAKDSLTDALAVIYSTETYGGSVPFDDVCDTVTDDIYDALAWLEKTS